MGKLKEVLEGYESVEVVPSLFIFMGNFCSSPCNLSFHSFANLRWGVNDLSPCHYVIPYPISVWITAIAYRSQFGKLGRMIAEYPRIQEQSRFLFIPSPDDAGGFCVQSCSCLYISLLQSKFWYVLSSGPSSVLPRCALPKYLTEELQKEIPNALFMSNPCRYNATLHYSCLEAW